jgi:hypothetical protein
MISECQHYGMEIIASQFYTKTSHALRGEVRVHASDIRIYILIKNSITDFTFIIFDESTDPQLL